MTPESESTQSHKPAHPTAGWIAIIPIPASTQNNADPPSNIERMFGFVTTGVEAAIVIEIGYMGSSAPDEYHVGDKIYYSEGKGIQIGDFYYLAYNSVIAWESADT